LFKNKEVNYVEITVYNVANLENVL